MNESKMGKMTAGKIALLTIVTLVIFLIIGGFTTYNSMVGKEENVNSKWSGISTQLQRRSDLIPNLVNTVKGYAAHETEVMTAISDARSKLAGANGVEEKAQANNELSSALSRLMVIVENYPTLKADSQYTALMDELSGTENRIAVARNDYNEAVNEYNKKIKTFPGSLFAGMFGFKQAEYFQAQAGSETAPTVNFGS